MKICTSDTSQKGEILYLIFLLLILGPLNLKAEVLRTNPDHSEILFEIPYLKLSEVTGRFRKFTGELELTEGRPTKVVIAIDADSIDTGNTLRDNHLKGYDFFNSKTHPSNRFDSEKIITLNNKFRAHGKLLFLGGLKPLDIDFSLSEEVIDTWGKMSRFVKFDVSLNRNELGLKWNKTLPGDEFLLGDAIRVWGSFQLQPKGKLTHSTKHMIPDTLYAREREKILRGEKKTSRFSLDGGSVAPSLPEAETPKASMKEISPEQVDPRSRILWQLAFGVLGLMGFFATILIGFQFKKWIHQRTLENHSETGPVGLLTDLFIILIVFIYAVSLWEVGWG